MTQLADAIGSPAQIVTVPQADEPAAAPAPRAVPVESLSPTELLDLARWLAAEPGLVRRLAAVEGERSWLALPTRPGLQAWLIAWPAGTGTGWHDHGDAKGAMVVVTGELTERSTQRPAGHAEGASLDLPDEDGRLRRFAAGQGRSFGARHVHEVTNEAAETAYSVHVYYPDLTLMRRYVPSDGRLLPIGAESAQDW